MIDKTNRKPIKNEPKRTENSKNKAESDKMNRKKGENKPESIIAKPKNKTNPKKC